MLYDETINVQESNLCEEGVVSGMRLTEELYAQGHPNLLGTHRMTFEITKSRDLSKRGDCVIGVRATKGPSDFSSEFKRACSRQDAKVTVRLVASGISEVIQGSGSQGLTFAHASEMVGRKSSFASDRTIMVRADKSAFDLNRRLIEALNSNKTVLAVQILVEV